MKDDILEKINKMLDDDKSIVWHKIYTNMECDKVIEYERDCGEYGKAKFLITIDEL